MLDVKSHVQQAHYNPLLRVGLRHARFSPGFAVPKPPSTRRPRSGLLSLTRRLTADTGREEFSPLAKKDRAMVGKQGGKPENLARHSPVQQRLRHGLRCTALCL